LFGCSTPRIFRGAAPDKAVFLISAELRYKARGKPKNGELGGFRLISTLKL
jgi:hypothetical protein